MRMKQIISIILVFSIVSGMFAPIFMAPAMAQEDGQNIERAELNVFPDRALDASVDEREADDGLRLYNTEGNTVEIKPTNIDSEVRSFGVEGSTGSMTYDSDIDRYVFDAERTDGTYKLYWDTREEISTGDNSTQTENVRYEAYISLSNTDFTVVPSGEYNDINQDAQLWQEWESNLQGLFGDNVDVQAQTDAAFQFLRWRASGFQIISEDVTNILVILSMTWGGRLLLIAMLFAIGLASYKAAKYYNTREKNDPYERDIIERENSISKRESEQMLQGVDFEKVFPDEFRSDLYREATGADNLDEWFKQLSASITPGYIYKLKLHVLSTLGYVAVPEKDDNDDIISINFTDEPETDDYIDLVNCTDDIVQFAMEDEFVNEFNLNKCDVDPNNIEPVELKGEHIDDLEGLINKIDEDLAEGPIETQQVAEEWVEALGFIKRHPATDDKGRIVPLRSVLNDIARAFRVVSDKNEVPIVREQARAIEYLLETADVEKDASKIVNEPIGDD